VDILSATVARASDFVVFLKVLIIISSMLVFTSSELISTSSELISTSSELISTNSELISTIAEQIFYNAPRAINLRPNTALNIVFIFCKNLQIWTMLYGVLEGYHINLTNLYFRFTLPPQKKRIFCIYTKKYHYICIARYG
jgi:hypothetical protein